MNFEEYVTINGGNEENLVGRKVYICDYRLTDGCEKALRHVPPTLVQIVSNKEAKKTIYYSNIHFKPFNKRGDGLLKKEIAPFDNTGYRSYKGTAVNVFEDLLTCQQYYNEQISYAQRQYEQVINQVTREIELLETMKIQIK